MNKFLFPFLCASLLGVLWFFALPIHAFAQNYNNPDSRKTREQLDFEVQLKDTVETTQRAASFENAGRNIEACTEYRSSLDKNYRASSRIGWLALQKDANGRSYPVVDAKELLDDLKAKSTAGRDNTCSKPDVYSVPASGGNNSSNSAGGGARVPYNANNSYSVGQNIAAGFDFNGALRNLQSTLDTGYNSAVAAANFYKNSQITEACQSARSSAAAYAKAKTDARDILGRRNYARYISISDIDKNAAQSASDASEFYCK